MVAAAIALGAALFAGASIHQNYKSGIEPATAPSTMIECEEGQELRTRNAGDGTNAGVFCG